MNLYMEKKQEVKTQYIKFGNLEDTTITLLTPVKIAEVTNGIARV